jgi:small-conductance mechanosensitive channel
MFAIAVSCIIIVPNISYAASELLPSIDKLRSVQLQAINSGNPLLYSTALEREQENIRKTVQTTLEEKISSLQTEYSVAQNDQTVPTAIDVQNKIIESLEEYLVQTKADISVETVNRDTIQSTLNTLDENDATNRKTVTEELVTSITTIDTLQILEKQLQQSINQQQERLIALKQQQLRGQYTTLWKITLYSGIILLIIGLERITRRVLAGRIADDNRRYHFIKLFSLSTYSIVTIIAIVSALAAWPSALSSLAIIGAGIAIALQDLVKDFVGWVLILRNQLFARGHRITVGQLSGEVVDIGLLRTSVLEIGIGGTTEALERSGKLLSFPNSQVLTQALTNHSKTSTYMRAEMKLTITLESDYKKAKEIFTKIVDQYTLEYAEKDVKQTRQRGRELYYIPNKIAENQIFMTLNADGIEFIIRFTVPIGERRAVISTLTEAILDALQKQKNIALAYTTIQYYQA